MQASAEVDIPTSSVSPFLNEMMLTSAPIGVLPGRAISMALGLIHFPSRQMNFMTAPPGVAESYHYRHRRRRGSFDRPTSDTFACAITLDAYKSSFHTSKVPS